MSFVLQPSAPNCPSTHRNPISFLTRASCSSMESYRKFLGNDQTIRKQPSDLLYTCFCYFPIVIVFSVTFSSQKYTVPVKILNKFLYCLFGSIRTYLDMFYAIHIFFCSMFSTLCKEVSALQLNGRALQVT